MQRNNYQFSVGVNSLQNADVVSFSGKRSEKAGKKFKLASPTNLSLQQHLGCENMELLTTLHEYGKSRGVDTYLVGGAVRDCLIDKPNHDLDIVVNGSAHDFVEGLHKENPKRFPRYILRTKTNRAKIWANGQWIDVAPLKPSGQAAKGVDELRQAFLQNIQQRDFTVNSMFIKLGENKDGKLKLKLFDFYKGKQDLKNKKLKCVTSHSFTDDPIRILRGFRLGAKYGMKTEAQTHKLEQQCLSKPLKKFNAYYYRLSMILKDILFKSDSPMKNIESMIKKKYYKMLF